MSSYAQSLMNFDGEMSVLEYWEGGLTLMSKLDLSDTWPLTESTSSLYLDGPYAGDPCFSHKLISVFESIGTALEEFRVKV